MLTRSNDGKGAATSKFYGRVPPRALVAAVATLVLVAGCGASAIKGEITDSGIALSVDHGGPVAQFELHNAGTLPCDVAIALTALPVAALPIVDGRVAIVNGDGPDLVRPITTYEAAPPYTLGRIEPGAVFRIEIALEGTPKSEDRVLLCNGIGDYALGRYAVLRFDR